ncbi:hypothetical protein EVAR_24182_1 [Eumeta japonica]|uniref:Uncharacterized protein n=1 Tax=Eumeta variegata TaxID=151549 RepID=A0A4C1W636_EUMVA|nr:hypothetical protein EVAR_24182_1 [Eumeta japonica]
MARGGAFLCHYAATTLEMSGRRCAYTPRHRRAGVGPDPGGDRRKLKCFRKSPVEQLFKDVNKSSQKNSDGRRSRTVYASAASRSVR